MNAQSSTVLTTSGDFTAAVTRVVEFEVSARTPCFYTQKIDVQVISIFDSSIVRQADIHSYSVTVTFTAGRLTIAFKVTDDDDDAFEQR